MTATLAEAPRAERNRELRLAVVRAIGAELAWSEHGACYGDNDDTMYPHNREREDTKVAVERCQILCPVQEQCLAYALDTDQRHGIWGGLTERDRAKLRPKKKRTPRAKKR